MPTNKRTVKNGVGQLTLTFGLDPKDDAQETQDNGPSVSIEPAGVMSNPSGSGADMASSSPGRKRKWNSLIDKVYTLPNLRRAWERVRENNGAAGADGMTVRRFAARADERLAALSDDLRAKTYRPQPVRRKLIPKASGGMRPLGIPTVRDRIVQQAILQVLEPVFEPTFSTRSHGFRPGRGCATALSVVDRAVKAGYTHVVDADIQSFFDKVDHEKLLDAINEEVADGSLLKLIRKILTAGVEMPQTGDIEPTTLGTPQGGPLSPLLANIYLSVLDYRLSAAGHGLVRYADDFVIFARSEEEAHQAHALTKEVMAGLSLTLHPEKTRIVSVAAGFEFLGFHYFIHAQRGVCCKEVRRKSVARFREAIRLRTPRLHTGRAVKFKHLTFKRLNKNQRVEDLITSLNAYLSGWHWYFKHIDLPYQRPFQGFDGFVRRRLRSSIVGRTGNGRWTVRLTNDLLAHLGLVSLERLQAAHATTPRYADARKG